MATAMFIAMNRFQIVKGREAEFENIWAQCDSHLEGVPGFKEFEDWTQSEAFRKAYANAGGSRDIYLGHLNFEGFESVL